MNPLNVMIVDDSVVMTQLVAKALGELGHKVVMTAKSGAEAISGYGTCNPDLVTMDITMPGMSGIEATEKIVISYPDAHIVMVTSLAQKSMVMDAIRVGAKGYVLKPIVADKLRNAIERTFQGP
jgi:two-component system, chemotaxis family, chemotaxis protein CheY